MLLLPVLAGITLLLLCILWLRLPAFLALLIGSITTGLLAGLDGVEMMRTIQEGMGATLGFVAVVVGLGAMFGAILEQTGGAQALASHLIRTFGIKNAPLALLLTGFLVSIPVFFDLGFIILIPLVYALQRQTGRSLLVFALPLLAGLAVTHAFIPPTPGPVAVADIVKADLGWVILFGALAGLPAAIVGGLLFGRTVSRRLFIPNPLDMEEVAEEPTTSAPASLVFDIIGLPILLILTNTFLQSGVVRIQAPAFRNVMALVGHPFGALILANLLAWYLLGRFRGFSSKQLLEVTSKSMAPAGTIILLTGAGGVLKQTLVNTGAGEQLAGALQEQGISLLVFAFLSAVIVRVLQGSATVAMITAAGFCAPLLDQHTLEPPQTALLVVAISSGASVLSHVNDSGFWLVKQYLGLTETQAFQSWTLMTTIIGLVGFATAFLLNFLV